MLSILSFFAVDAASVVAGVRIALAALALICTGFIIFIVMKQSGNSDGTEAFTGSSNKSDESETYYGKNAGSRKEARLKLLTYVAAGVLAVCCIVMIILQAVIK
ncbi:MAG: preprotein translocase subunit SecG [Clostridiales bacterium]|nr:preprotein translocase subunit SecG [Clostridiales bacterium]